MRALHRAPGWSVAAYRPLLVHMLFFFAASADTLARSVQLHVSCNGKGRRGGGRARARRFARVALHSLVRPSFLCRTHIPGLRRQSLEGWEGPLPHRHFFFGMAWPPDEGATTTSPFPDVVVVKSDLVPDSFAYVQVRSVCMCARGRVRSSRSPRRDVCTLCA